MWTFYELKNKAKGVLMQNYWGCFFAVILYTLLSDIIGNLAFFNMKTPSEQEMVELLDSLSKMKSEELLRLLYDNIHAIVPVILIIVLISLIVSVFITTPFSVGQNRFFTESARGNTKIEEIFYPFANGWQKYFSIVKLCFMKALFLFLWGLVGVVIMTVLSLGLMLSSFVIGPFIMLRLLPFLVVAMWVTAYLPMIIKSFEYFCVEYIVADEPEIGWRDAFKKSKQLMRGEKLKALLFALSFIGWVILGLMFFGIGIFFVMPYINMSFAELYLKLKEKTENSDTESDNKEV